MKISELRRKRGELVTHARKLLDKADEEKRELTSEEDAKYAELIEQVDKLGKDVEKEERLLELEKEMAESQGVKAAKPDTDNGAGAERKIGFASEEYREAFCGFLSYGISMPAQYRSLQADLDVSGGYLVAPEQMVQELIKGIDDEVHVRQMATKFSVAKAQSLGVPSLDSNPSDADWTSELSIGSEDTSMSFGKRELSPHPLSKLIKVSNKMLTASFLDVEQIVRQAFVQVFAQTEEKAFLTGTGAAQPLGVFTASANGISTARDVSTGNTATSIQFDGLIEAKYTLKGQYWPKAIWMFHRDALKQITKLKDGNGQYIWRQSVRNGEPDTLLGLPFLMSEFAPNTFTTGKYVGIIGDFSTYWIVDALDMQIQRLVELYAEKNQTGFIGRLEADGMPVLEEAFARVKLA